MMTDKNICFFYCNLLYNLLFLSFSFYVENTNILYIPFTPYLIIKNEYVNLTYIYISKIHNKIYCFQFQSVALIYLCIYVVYCVCVYYTLQIQLFNKIGTEIQKFI